MPFWAHTMAVRLIVIRHLETCPASPSTFILVLMLDSIPSCSSIDTDAECKNALSGQLEAPGNFCSPGLSLPSAHHRPLYSSPSPWSQLYHSHLIRILPCIATHPRAPPQPSLPPHPPRPVFWFFSFFSCTVAVESSPSPHSVSMHRAPAVVSWPRSPRSGRGYTAHDDLVRCWALEAGARWELHRA
jgi:hypothetical protein